MHDRLAEFLGAADGGVIEYRYADAVRLAGHSCPTVAGAWLMTLRGLRALYGEALPVRGEITASLRDARDHGTTGVVASIVQLVTGAAAETGFQGIGPTAVSPASNCSSFLSRPSPAPSASADATPGATCTLISTPAASRGRKKCAASCPAQFPARPRRPNASVLPQCGKTASG